MQCRGFTARKTGRRMVDSANPSICRVLGENARPGRGPRRSLLPVCYPNRLCHVGSCSIPWRVGTREGADVHGNALRGNWPLRVSYGLAGVGAGVLSLGTLEVASIGEGTRHKWTAGERVVVCDAAGSRLSGKQGVVLGFGATRSRLRVLLDGSRGPITLHVTFVNQVTQQNGGSERCDEGGVRGSRKDQHSPASD